MAFMVRSEKPHKLIGQYAERLVRFPKFYALTNPARPARRVDGFCGFPRAQLYG